MASSVQGFQPTFATSAAAAAHLTSFAYASPHPSQRPPFLNSGFHVFPGVPTQQPFPHPQMTLPHPSQHAHNKGLFNYGKYV